MGAPCPITEPCDSPRIPGHRPDDVSAGVLHTAPVLLLLCPMRTETVDSAPHGVQSGDRATWFGLYYNITKGRSQLHPVGLALLVNHKALDPAQWTIQKVFFQGCYYESLAQLEEQF